MAMSGRLSGHGELFSSDNSGHDSVIMLVSGCRVIVDIVRLPCTFRADAAGTENRSGGGRAEHLRHARRRAPWRERTSQTSRQEHAS